jgi:hypothetical protein
VKRISFLLIFMLCALCAGNAAVAETALWRGELRQSYEIDGVMLAELAADFPQVSGANESEALTGVNAGIRGFILTQGGFDVACAAALEAYENATELFAATQYGLKAHAEPVLRTGTLMAVRYDFTLESGGPHPWNIIAAQHYDLRTGKPVALEMLIKDPAALRALVAEEIRRGLTEQKFEAFDESAATVAEWPLTQGLLTDRGLLVFYNEGELGPVAVGAFELLIPYERLPGAFVEGIASFGPAALAEEKAKVEGPGFDTPEQATEAYLDALRAADVDGMIATFAMETYVERFDFERYLNRVKAYTGAMEQRLPSASTFAKGINLAQRQGSLAVAICRQYLALFIDDTAILEGAPIPLTEEEVTELARALADPAHLQTLGSLRLAVFVPPAQLSDQYDSEQIGENISARAGVFGADELVDVAARVEIGERRYLFFFDVARYGDRWYNLGLSGTLANLMYVGATSGGILREQ